MLALVGAPVSGSMTEAPVEMRTTMDMPTTREKDGQVRVRSNVGLPRIQSIEAHVKVRPSRGILQTQFVLGEGPRTNSPETSPQARIRRGRRSPRPRLLWEHPRRMN